MSIPFDLSTYAIAAAIVFGGYVVFGITAFGAALFTVPLLTHLFPLEFVLPMCVLLDVSAALALGVRFSRAADRSELLIMAPCSLAGAILGVTLLIALPRDAILAAFGLFLVAYGTQAMRRGETFRRIGRAWGALAGFSGGAMGTLFGVGAPPYAIYLARRIADKGALRATLSNIVLLSTSIRALVFLAGGLMLADRLITAALLLPFALAGLWLGNRFHGRLSRLALLRTISALLTLIGASLLYRALA
jgi:uncharacterized membrane protein YfcA